MYLGRYRDDTVCSIKSHVLHSPIVSFTILKNGAERAGVEPANPARKSRIISSLGLPHAQPFHMVAGGRNRTGRCVLAKRHPSHTVPPAQLFQQNSTDCGLDERVGLSGRMNQPKNSTRSPKRVTNTNGALQKGAPFLSLGELLRKASGAEALRLLFTQRPTV